MNINRVEKIEVGAATLVRRLPMFYTPEKLFTWVDTNLSARSKYSGKSVAGTDCGSFLNISARASYRVRSSGVKGSDFSVSVEAVSVAAGVGAGTGSGALTGSGLAAAATGSGVGAGVATGSGVTASLTCVGKE